MTEKPMAIKKRMFKVLIQTDSSGFTEWQQPRMDKYLLGCCDCGLVHEMQFRIVGVRKFGVQFRARRARNYTAQLRRQQARQVGK